MNTRPAPPALSGLTPVCLDELVARAALLTRVDRKYVVPVAQVDALVTAIAAHARVLEIDGVRAFGYESVYFDTPELTSYLLTAHRRRRRFKVRTRTYLDSQLCWLEVKTPGARGSTVKHRRPHHPQQRTTLAPGHAFIEAVLSAERFAPQVHVLLSPTLVSRYRRSTLLLPGPAGRLTIDTELTWSDGHRTLALPGLAVIETKTGSAASDVDRLLWHGGHRPVRISKYATGLAALRPELPATAWRRTLRRHFAAAPEPTPLPLSWPQAS